MPQTIAIIQGHPITANDNGSVTFGPCKADICADGSGPSFGDPDWQNDTALHHGDNALDATKVPFIVVPPIIRKGVVGIVLGCQAAVAYNGKTCSAVVGDIGPHDKLGEISVACAEALGIPSSPIDGGVDSGVSYHLLPGVPAVVDGITYNLQPS